MVEWITGGVLGLVALALLVRWLDRGTSPPPGDAGAGSTVEELLRAGRKLEAIKRYREQTGVGLREAKEAVEALERGERAPPPVPPSSDSKSHAEVARLVRDGQLIAAIKLYRELTGVGLAEAKAAVDKLRDGQ